MKPRSLHLFQENCQQRLRQQIAHCGKLRPGDARSPPGNTRDCPFPFLPRTPASRCWRSTNKDRFHKRPFPGHRPPWRQPAATKWLSPRPRFGPDHGPAHAGICRDRTLVANGRNRLGRSANPQISAANFAVSTPCFQPLIRTGDGSGQGGSACGTGSFSAAGRG